MERWRAKEGHWPSEDPCHSLIILYNKQRDLPFSSQRMKQVISFLLHKLKMPSKGVIFHFVSQREICKLHKKIFNDPSPTDCITLSMGVDSPILGEGFICPKTAILYAKEHSQDPQQELLRYVIHCLLHMLGLEDKTTQQRAKMRQKEKICLTALETAFTKKVLYYPSSAKIRIK